MIRHQITIIPLFVFLFSFFFFPFNEIDINCQYNGKIENLFIFKYKRNYFPQSWGIKNDKPLNPL